MPRSSVTVGNIALGGIVRSAGTITAVPSGWTLVDEQTFNTDDVLAVYWRVTGAADPTSWAFTLSTTMRWACINLEFSGVNTTTPIDVSDTQANASSASVVAPSIDPNFLEDMLVYFGGSASTGTWTADGAMTEPASNGEKPAAALVTIGSAYQLLASGAATGTRTGTCSVAAINAGMLIGLRDASATPESQPATGTISVGTATADGLSVTGTPSGNNATGTISVAAAIAAGERVMARDNKRTFGPLVYSRTLGKVGRKVG
jgi:hypothetical protein